MTKEEKASLLVLIRNKYNLYLIIGTFILLGYELFNDTPSLMTITPGGYYSFIAMIICFIVGIFIPILTGAFMGGYERSTGMLDYKLVAQSLKTWIKTQFTAMIKFFIAILLFMSLLGAFLDLINNSSTGFYLYYSIPRFLIILFIWIFWGILSFLIALLLRSPAMSFIICSAYFYIEQYLYFPSGILWNQKSILHVIFNEDNLPYGIVQSSFHSFSSSLIYLSVLLVTIIAIIILYLKKAYPNK